MANILHNGVFIPFKTDIRQLILIKCRSEKKCRICNEVIPKNSYCVGKTASWYSYGKCCLKCSEKFLNNFIKSIEEFKEFGEETLKDIQKNKRKYDEVNMVAKI